ncbi:MAG: YihY/virulence factor BrkB family protein [Candidatus Nanopelagicales bacterium]
MSEESATGGGPSLVDRVRDWADALQQRHAVLGFPVAVVKKYGDDGGARHAAMLTYYGFLSIFPALLLVVVALTRVLQGNDELRTQWIDAIVPKEFRQTVEDAVQTLPTAGLPLVIAVVALLFSALGVVFSAYHSLNALANVPHRKRLAFVPRYLRIVAMLLLLLVGAIGIGALTVLTGGLPDLPYLSRLSAFGGTFVLVFLLLWAAVELLLPHRARFAVVWPAATVGSLAVAGVLSLGAVILPRLVARSGAVYGSFATIVGTFTLLLIVGQALVFAAEIAVVRRRRLWPRGLDPLTPTDADRRALTLVAREQERTPIERITPTFDGDPDER